MTFNDEDGVHDTACSLPCVRGYLTSAWVEHDSNLHVARIAPFPSPDEHDHTLLFVWPHTPLCMTTHSSLYDHTLLFI